MVKHSAPPRRHVHFAPSPATDIQPPNSSRRLQPRYLRSDTFFGERYHPLARLRSKDARSSPVGNAILTIFWHLLSDAECLQMVWPRVPDLHADSNDETTRSVVGPKFATTRRPTTQTRSPPRRGQNSRRKPSQPGPIQVTTLMMPAPATTTSPTATSGRPLPCCRAGGSSRSSGCFVGLRCCLAEGRRHDPV